MPCSDAEAHLPPVHQRTHPVSATAKTSSIKGGGGASEGSCVVVWKRARMHAHTHTHPCIHPHPHPHTQTQTHAPFQTHLVAILDVIDDCVNKLSVVDLQRSATEPMVSSERPAPDGRDSAACESSSPRSAHCDSGHATNCSFSVQPVGRDADGMLRHVV